MYSNDQGNYDVIGDIHGKVEKLEQLLIKLEYTKSELGYYSHPTRKVVFLGDFIDGGNEHIKVINIVKPMVENQAAYAIMANHEFNAISFHTSHPETGSPLRKHTDKNIEQHQSFLAEYENNKESMFEVIEWFKTLPLYLELPEIRAVHACWSDDEINNIKQFLNAENVIKPEVFEEFLIKANTEHSPEFDAIEILLKGLEIKLPEGKSFLDKSKNRRFNMRVKWWLTDGKTYDDYALVPNGTIVSADDIRQELISNYLYGKEEKPVFIGHYWLNGQPEIQAKNIACLDYSAGKENGKQVAYRWNKNDKILSDDNFVCAI